MKLIFSRSVLLALLISMGLGGLSDVRAQETAPVPRPAAQEATIHLPAKPSELLRASDFTWEVLLEQMDHALAERAARSDELDGQSRIELHIYGMLLAQARQSWPKVLAHVSSIRALQNSASGRETAGLLNEVLARVARDGGGTGSVQRQLRDQVLAMPWSDVGPAILALRDQLEAAKVEGIESFAANKLDLSAAVSSNNASLGFLMQILAMRFQLLEVMPRKGALVAGLNEAIALRKEAK